MNYRDLLQWLNTFTPEQLAMNVTVFSDETGEYLPVVADDFSVGSDVIDDNHPILIY